MRHFDSIPHRHTHLHVSSPLVVRLAHIAVENTPSAGRPSLPTKSRPLITLHRCQERRRRRETDAHPLASWLQHSAQAPTDTACLVVPAVAGTDGIDGALINHTRKAPLSERERELTRVRDAKRRRRAAAGASSGSSGGSGARALDCGWGGRRAAPGRRRDLPHRR